MRRSDVIRCKNKISAQRKTRERIQGNQKFKQFQHKDNHDQDHTTHLEMRVKVIYSLKSVIYRDGGKIQPYSKTLDSSPGMFTSLMQIQAYIKECEQNKNVAPRQQRSMVKS